MEHIREKLGLVHIYTGKTKGKSTTAMGLAVRAAGRGLRVNIYQLFKDDTGEKYAFEKLANVKYTQFKPKHPYFIRYSEKEIGDLKEKLAEFLRQIDFDCDLLVLDEIAAAIHWKLVEPSEIAEMIKSKPKNTEFVMTGQDFPQELVDLADYVVEMKYVKHPYEDKGIEARKGIEY